MCQELPYLSRETPVRNCSLPPKSSQCFQYHVVFEGGSFQASLCRCVPYYLRLLSLRPDRMTAVVAFLGSQVGGPFILARFRCTWW